MNLHALDLPFGLELQTPRLLLCAPSEKADIGPEINEAIRASWSELRLWMPWAKMLPSEEDSAMNVRKARWQWGNRSELDFVIRLRSTRQLIGKCGLHTLDTNVGRAEIGYWIDSRWSGQSLMSEAVARLIRFADETGFQRLEIRFDARNERSKNVAKRAGFEWEGTLRRVRFDNQDRLCDLEVWSRLR